MLCRRSETGRRRSGAKTGQGSLARSLKIQAKNNKEEGRQTEEGWSAQRAIWQGTRALTRRQGTDAPRELRVAGGPEREEVGSF